MRSVDTGCSIGPTERADFLLYRNAGVDIKFASWRLAMRGRFICFLVPASLAAIGLLRLTSDSSALDSQVKLTKTDVGAPPERLFALIEDFHQWGTWSPHEKANPAVRRTYSGPAKGKGAIYEWDGGDSIGAGRARIAESDAPARIVVDLDLTKPATGHLALDFTLERTGAVTKIDVATSGPSDLVKTVMSMFFNGSLIGISCAADGSPKPFCNLIMKDLVDRP
jgi:hypothetical protein